MEDFLHHPEFLCPRNYSSSRALAGAIISFTSSLVSFLVMFFVLGLAVANSCWAAFFPFLADPAPRRASMGNTCAIESWVRKAPLMS